MRGHRSQAHADPTGIDKRQHNLVRTADTIDQMIAMVRGMDGKRLRYRDLVS